MLREDRRLIDGIHIAVTGVLMAAAYAALYALMRDRQPPLAPPRAYVPTVALMAAFVMGALSQRRPEAAASLADRLRDLALAYGFAVFSYGFIAYTLRLQHLSRLYVYGGLCLSAALSAAWLAAAHLRRRRRGEGTDLRRVLLVGDAEGFGEAQAMIQSRPALGLEVAGSVLLAEQGVEALARALDSSVVDYALFAGCRRSPELMEEAMVACHERGVEIWLKTDLMRRDLSFSRVDYLEEIPVLVCSAAPRPGPALLAKRAMDVALSAALLCALAPLLLLLAVLVRLGGPGPVLFRQRRIGLNGREFTLLKFRSMRNGEAELRNDMSGPVFKMKGDPRVTPLGRFLRKYSLDELPQLWNVLVGEMSLVGPRPPLPAEVERYKVWQRRRLSMRPGLTGLWQVNGRNSIPDFDDWVRLDLSYLDGWSLWLDLRIILKTVPAVLKGTGL